MLSTMFSPQCHGKCSFFNKVIGLFHDVIGLNRNLATYCCYYPAVVQDDVYFHFVKSANKNQICVYFEPTKCFKLGRKFEQFRLCDRKALRIWLQLHSALDMKTSKIFWEFSLQHVDLPSRYWTSVLSKSEYAKIQFGNDRALDLVVLYSFAMISV